MAVLAIAGAGALGASALGLGWQAGWLLGSVVGQALFAPGRTSAPDQEGPRLSDLTVSSSAYGAPIPIAYGTLRMGGNMIWSAGISGLRMGMLRRKRPRFGVRRLGEAQLNRKRV
jgi:hypothetical protein